jgi:hypothetical protein
VALLAAALTAAAAVTGCSGGAEGTTSPDLATMAPSTTAPLLQWVAPVPPFGTPSNAGSYTLVALVTGTASATFTVQNNGDRASGALAVSLTATGAAAYTITSNTCSGVSLGKGKGCSVAVQFAPTTAGAASAVLSVTSKKLDAQATVTLTGAALRRATLVGGDRHTCGLTSAGAAYCWGDNSYGQLGTTTNSGTSTPNPTPTAVSVPSGVTFVSLAAGFYHTCGLTSAGAAYCWGQNSYGQLGTTTNTGTDTPNPTPTAVSVPSGVTFGSLAAGAYHTCGLTSAGGTYCWGWNYYGQLGTTTNTGTDTPNPTPTAVSVPSGVTFVSLEAGVYHTCGLTSAGAAYCWGNSGDGQLGNGTTTASSAPVAVSAPEGVTFASLAAGSYHNCGVTSAGAAYCWGSNGYGQLGDGTTTSRATPTAVTAGLTFATP